MEDQDVKSIVEEQISLGFHAITDGEYRRHMFWASVWHGLKDMKEEDTPDPDLFRRYIPGITAFTESGYKPGETVICTGAIKHVCSTYTDQFDYFKSLVPKDKFGELKLTLAAPNWYYLKLTPGDFTHLTSFVLCLLGWAMPQTGIAPLCSFHRSCMQIRTTVFDF